MADFMTNSKSGIDEKNIVCTVCPIGCRIIISIENGVPVNVSGNSCPRGKKYAFEEITNPQRTLTSTIAINGTEKTFLPVRTNRPIPKKSLKEAMQLIKKQTATPPIRMGDVVVENFIVDGTSLIACKDIM